LTLILRRIVAAIAASLGLLASVGAAELTVEGSAPIRNGDVGQARELATRRALASAAALGSATISAQTLVRDGVVVNDTAQLRSSACTENSQVLGETIGKDELTQRLQVTVRDSGACRQSCQQATLNRLIVAGFSVEHPEQILPIEKSWLTNLTPVEIARWVDKRRQVLVVHDATVFPHLTPDRAPKPFLTVADRETPFSVLARHHRGQYVLAGVYRNIGFIDQGWFDKGIVNRGLFGKTRLIEIDAFIHDGVNGAVLDRKTFSAVANGQVLMTPRPAVGTAEFYASDLGRVWGRLVSDIADWATDKISCMPFVARVLKIEGQKIYLDAGADSGLSVGDTLALHTWRRPPAPVRGEDKLVLGEEKSSRTTVSIKYRYPEFSVAEMIEAGHTIDIFPGDLLYAK
jgi:hypothetical protein